MIRRLLYNTGSNLAVFFVHLIVTFIMAPIYLMNMGHYDYGIREMVLAFVGYMGMLDLGMRPTISRFASMHNALNDRENLLAVYASSLVFMGIVGFMLAMFFFLWAAGYPEMLVPEDGAGDVDKYRLFLLIIGAKLIFTFPQYVTESYLEGLQRYYLKNIILIVTAISFATVSYIFITPQNALILLSALAAGSVTIKLLIYGAILSRPAMGVIKFEFNRFSWIKLKEMLSFGFKSLIQGASSRIETTSARLVIGIIAGPAAVPLYSIPQTLVGYIKSISMNLTHAFMPLFSDLDARGQQDRIRQIYLTSSKLVVGLVVPMAIGISVIGGPFVSVWMPGQFDQQIVDMIIMLLAVYFTVPYLNPFVSRYLTAINKHRIFAVISPPAALLNLGLSIWLVMKLGVVGAALGAVFPVFLATPIYLYYSCRHLHISIVSYLRASVFPAMIPGMIMGFVIAWFRLELGLDSYSQILACITLGGIIYSFCFWIISVSDQERSIVRGWLK